MGADEPVIIADQIIDKTQVQYFSKGPKRDDLVAIGDDHGLFVISKPTRNWYPTKDAVEKWKVKTVIEVNETRFELEFN